MQDDTFSLLKQILPPIHPEGWNFVTVFAVISMVLFLVWVPLGWLGVILTIWCFYFFRNPVRVTPKGAHLVVSPADGVVSGICEAEPPPELGLGKEKMTRVSIFMSVFNVHVNRVPATGTILRRAYTPGKFFNASLDKASIHNERMALAMTLDDGRILAFVQIAGLIARRIRCDIKPEQRVSAGDEFGLIRFGSRLDVYLPKNVQPLVEIGQTMVAGETIISKLDAIIGENASDKAEKEEA